MEHLNDLLLGNLDLHLNFHISFINDHTHLFFAADYTDIKDPDVLGQMQKAWNNFVKTGQIWATIIGIIIGYMFKSLTSFG